MPARPAPALARHAPHLVLGALCAGLVSARWAPVDPRLAVAVAALPAAGLAAALARAPARVALALLVLTTAGAGLAWGAARMQATAPPALRLPARAEGVVAVDAPARPGVRGWSARGVARSLRVGGRPVPPGTRLLLDLGERPPPGVGTLLRVAGSARAPAAQDAPGWWRAHLARQRIAMRLDAPGWRAAGRRGGLAGLRDRWRSWATAQAGRGLRGDRAAVVRGMALGGGAELSQGAQQAFRDSGLWHLLAVSGQNVGVVAMAALAALRAAGVGRRPAVAASGVLLVAYCLACDGGASVARAGVVGALGVLGELAAAPALRWHLLLAGLAAILALDPRAIEDPGLQLSFTAVAGLFLIAPALAPLLRGWLPGPVAGLAAQAAAAGLATAPVLAWRFGRLSLVGLVVNVLAVPLAGPVVVVALAGIGAGALLPAVGVALGWLAGLGAGLLLLMAGMAAAVPGAAVDLPAWSAVPLALLAVVPVVVAAWLRAPRGSRVPRPAAGRHGAGIAVAASLGAAAAAVLAWPVGGGGRPWPRRPDLVVLDVGQGEATLVRDPGGGALLVDTGPPGAPPAVVAGLRRAGVRRLEAVVLTHGSLDHVGGLPAVLGSARVGRLLYGGADAGSPGLRGALAAARAARVPVAPVRPGDGLALGAWRLVAVGRGRRAPGDDPNPGSLVLLATTGGMRALLTADAESGALAGVALGRVDVLKVAHHGSADPGLPALLRRLRPAVALVSVGAGNAYGHPDPGTLAALAAAGARTLRTDRAGDLAAGAAAGGGVVVTTGRGDQGAGR